ncbi:MAG: endonuclease/exonuclease/phosphatase family protein [Phycisphaeraceae bacterium]|nr:endonuclease/exonuclease/phosphatase family protein [Phycisphaeraceae bacterium]
MSKGTAKDMLRVVTFNIRNCRAPDGDDHWDHRRGLVVRSLRRHGADLIGLQEARWPQVSYLREQLGGDGYSFVGVGRDDGRDDHEGCGEFAAIFFRTERFEKLNEGHFWLSPTPDVVGSKGWDALLPRIVSWVRLRDRRNGRMLRYLNTHLEYDGVRSRHESARMIGEHARTIDVGEALVLTGDFNDGEGSPTYEAVLGDAGERASGAAPLVDVYRAGLLPKTCSICYESFNRAWSCPNC